jgi:hypothetical protein
MSNALLKAAMSNHQKILKEKKRETDNLEKQQKEMEVMAFEMKKRIATVKADSEVLEDKQKKVFHGTL